ncbi:MAG: DUF2220 family protein [Anaerolineaceae bacterium]|nr:DUF2220 family protein [Anaerolineaceae bacterium]
MLQPEPLFIPTPDVKLILHTLLDKLERRAAGSSATVPEAQIHRSIRTVLGELELPGYFSQMDPEPRQVANEQLQLLEDAGMLRLFWQPGEKGHLLESIVLVSGAESPLYVLLGRVSNHILRTRLEAQLLGDRFRFVESKWHYRAIQLILNQLKQNKSPSPFLLADPVFNEDLLTTLSALSQLNEETPYRIFSVRVFNNSKRFEDLKRAVIRLARLGQPTWKQLPDDELLRELNLVANPSYLLLAGPWRFVNADGEMISLDGFFPSFGLSAVQAMHLQRINVYADKVLCIENLTTFHAMAASLVRDPQSQSVALLCLAGNPSPACRRLLKHLSVSLPENTPLYVWADLDYGGFNILSQLRKEITPRFMLYNMDIDTFNRFDQFARPLTLSDRRNLTRQLKHTGLNDVHPVISYMLKCGVKLEQEAIPI